eukprot:14576773-Ditylum_brightwellii.AAC.1
MQLYLSSSLIGYGINELSLLDVINEIIAPSQRDSPEERNSFVPITMQCVNNIMKRNKEIAKVVSADSMDKQRAENGSEETRDHHFCKLQNYAFMLYKMGHVTYRENFKE